MGSGFETYIKETSLKLLLTDKVELIKRGLQEFNLSDDDMEKRIQEIFQDQDRLKVLEKQVPFWELTIGLCLLCWLIIRQKEKLGSLTANVRTWAELSATD